MKRKLEALEKEDDMDTALAKLIDQAAELNIQHFHCSMEFKKLLVEAVSLKQNFAERKMASIEFHAKIREAELRPREHENYALQASMYFENYAKYNRRIGGCDSGL